MLQRRQTKRRLSDISDLPKYNDTIHSDPVIVPKDTTRDHELVSAAEALTQLTGSVSPPPSYNDEKSTTPQIGSPLSSTSLQEMGHQIHPIVQRVNTISKLPLVTNAVKYYETSKRNYATFNYAAGIVEKAAMPVFNKIEVNLNNIHQAKLEERARLKKKRKLHDNGKDKHEIKKRIKFCLHILKLANDNISAKVNDLQDKIKESDSHQQPLVKKEPLGTQDSVREEPQVADLNRTESNSSVRTVPAKALETNHEIVTTVKKIVHVISNFRPSSFNVSDAEDDELCELHHDDVKLKKTIREIILRLPKQVSQNVPGAPKAPNQAINFARESLEMIGRLTTVFNEQLEKAEEWVDRTTEKKKAQETSPTEPLKTETPETQEPGVLRLKSEELEFKQ